MLSSRQILDLLADRSSMRIGRIRAVRRSATHLPPAVRAFLDDLETQEAPSHEKYTHPADRAGRSSHGQKALEPSDLAWIARLPTDPAQVSFADAERVAQLAANVDPVRHPSDRNLVDSVWKPIKEAHDRRAAEVALRNSSRALPAVPSSALTALGTAIATETPALSDQEALSRAGDALRSHRANQEATRQRAIDQAKATIASVDQASTSRQAVVA